jgi:hypothetical protein
MNQLGYANNTAMKIKLSWPLNQDQHHKKQKSS